MLPQEAKKRYDKETEKYCSVLEKHLSLSARRKEAQLQEVENLGPTCFSCFHSVLPAPLTFSSNQADTQVEVVRQQFYQVSLDYVFKVQEVQERKMFDFVEPVSPGSGLYPGPGPGPVCSFRLFLFPVLAVVWS